MFSILFHYPRVLARHRNGPSANDRERFLAHCARGGAALPQRHDIIEQSIAIRLDLRNVLLPQTGHRRIAEVLPAAVTLAEQIGDRRSLVWALGYTAHITIEFFVDSPDVPYAIQSGHRALELAQELGDPVLIASAQHFLVGVYHTLGQYKDAIRIGLEAARAGEALVANGLGRGVLSLRGVPSPPIFSTSGPRACTGKCSCGAWRPR